MRELLRSPSLTDSVFCSLRIGMESTDSKLSFQIVQIQNDMIPDTSSLLVVFLCRVDCRTLVFPSATRLPSIAFVWLVIPPSNKRVWTLLCVHSSDREWERCGNHRLLHESALSVGDRHCGEGGLSAVWHW